MDPERAAMVDAWPILPAAVKEGLEPPTETTAKIANSQVGDAKSDANDERNTPSSDLQSVIYAWPNIPSAVRDAIVAMAKAGTTWAKTH